MKHIKYMPEGSICSATMSVERYLSDIWLSPEQLPPVTGFTALVDLGLPLQP